jgi:hypothetical protein
MVDNVQNLETALRDLVLQQVPVLAVLLFRMNKNFTTIHYLIKAVSVL